MNRFYFDFASTISGGLGGEGVCFVIGRQIKEIQVIDGGFVNVNWFTLPGCHAP